ncbi:uncharacterized protein LOC122261129 isoform X2 [Penaeus japonicus]|nr:uncharacterized protein LOC122261129 isoform X2 [Penaeus japonicus]
MSGRELKQRVIEEYTTCVNDNKGLSCYELATTPVHKDEDKRIQVFKIGPENDQEIVSVLLLGETGAGKTHLINTLVNIVYGVQLADDFRFVLKDRMTSARKSQVHSQTDYVTAHLIYHMEGMLTNFNLMLIDTPGFNDTRSVEYHNRVTESLSSFLLNDFGIESLHCIGLVAKANQNRISEAQVNILNDFSSVLSHDVSPITELLATFASDDNLVHDVVRGAGISFSSMHEFDNWPLYVKLTNDSPRTRTNLQFRWENMHEECVTFLNALVAVPPLSLKRTRDLHSERKLLSEAKAQLMDESKRTASTVQTLIKYKMELKNRDEEAKRIKWKNSEKILTVGRVDLVEGYHAHNCKVCQRTCVTMCEDPSNVVAGVVGTTTGVGTAFATGVASAVGTGVVIGAEVGLLGGPIGAGIGVCIGLTSGLTIGTITGIMNRKTKAECPITSSDATCEASGCSHKLSDHDVEQFEIVEAEDSVEKVDGQLKLRYDSLMDANKKTRMRIRKEENTMQIYKEKLTMLAVRLVTHLRRIGELSMNPELITSEKIIGEMTKDVEDEEQIKILRMCLEAVKIMENPPGNDAMSQGACSSALHD